MSQAMSDEAALARIEKAVAAARRWSPLADDPPMPEPGSALARDDEVFPPLPTSTVTWYAITSTIDHLGLGADMLQAEGVVVLRPHAFYSLTRSALLGACQALWVLAGGPNERAVRSLLIVEDEVALQRRYLKAYLDDPTFEADVSEEMVSEMRDQVDRLTERAAKVRAELRGRGHTSKQRFQATSMITDVSAYMAKRENWLRRSIMDQWMRGSAAAHSRMWTMHFRDFEERPLPGGGAIRRVTSSINDIAHAYGTPALVLSEALDIWYRDRRKRDPGIPLLVTLPLRRPPIH